MLKTVTKNYLMYSYGFNIGHSAYQTCSITYIISQQHKPHYSTKVLSKAISLPQYKASKAKAE